MSHLITESGEYVPSVDGFNITATLKTGFDTLTWVKIGNLCHVQGQLEVASISGTGATYWGIDIELPFESQILTDGGSNLRIPVIVNNFSSPVLDSIVSGWIDGNSSGFMNLYEIDDNGLENHLVANSIIFLNFQYITI